MVRSKFYKYNFVSDRLGAVLGIEFWYNISDTKFEKWKKNIEHITKYN